jgi:hypothetical protein
MLKAILLILEPMATWEKIFLKRRGMVFIFLAHLLPLLLLTSACEGYGLIHWGKYRGQMKEIEHLKRFTRAEAVLYETSQFVLSLVVVFAGAKMVKAIGETFHGRHTYSQAFSAVAYGLSPLFLLRALDAFPSVNPWVTWSVGILLSVAALYHGFPRMMEPDPTHAFGLFLMGSLLLLLVSGLVRYVTWWFLAGRLGKLEAIFSDLASRLHF